MKKEDELFIYQELRGLVTVITRIAEKDQTLFRRYPSLNEAMIGVDHALRTMEKDHG